MKLPPDEYVLDNTDRPSAAEWRGFLEFVNNRPDYPDIYVGLHLGIKGIEKDEEENYVEALRLCDEANEHLYRSLRHATRRNIKKSIRGKCNELVDRRRTLSFHLNEDLRSVDPAVTFNINTAVALANLGITEDDNDNYKEALRLYKESEKYLLYCIEYEAKLDSTKDLLRGKLKAMTKRAKTLEAILERERITDKLRLMNCH